MKNSANMVWGCALVVGLTVSGCGGKEEAEIAPPPVSAAPVSLTATPEGAAPPVAGAPGEAPPPGAVAGGPPVPPEAGPTDIFKGMTEQQIKEFKETATPETHDLNLGTLQEAIVGFSAEFKRIPASQEEMVKARYLQRVLPAPKGKRYVIDKETGEVATENL